MLETFTPAVCGSRKRQIVAQVVFSVAAVATAALVGLTLGFAGSLLGGRYALYAAIALALVAAAREAGLLRFGIPQSRRQVPERWRFELPLPVWAGGYGAGLGAGFFTFQPFSTYWVACAGALAIARPLPAALCLSLYGAGRAAMIVWPRRRSDDPTAAVERLAPRRAHLVRVNVAALATCALLLALAPVAGGATRVAQNAYDPTYSAGALAFSRNGQVVVRPAGGGPEVVIPGAGEPSLSGELLAYRNGSGIRIVRWATGEEVGSIANGAASRPALDWPLVAFVRRDRANKRLVVRNMQTGKYRIHGSVKLATDMGRPSLRGGRLAWHTASRSESRILVKTLSTGKKRIVARSRIALLKDPSIYASRLVWVEGRSGASHLRLGWVGRGKGRVIESMKTRSRAYWTTGIRAGMVYSTRWTLASGASAVWSTRF